MRKPKLFLSLSLLFAACSSAPPAEKAVTAINYFDLKGYIAKEASLLKAKNPLLHKTVMVNNASEDKKLRIADWQKELSAFSDADINKSAWKGMFKVTRNTSQDIYESNDDKIPVKSLVVTHKNGKVKNIKILIRTKNLLYTSNDTLSYDPDSLYQIKKTQHIKLLNEKNYQITGKFYQ